MASRTGCWREKLIPPRRRRHRLSPGRRLSSCWVPVALPEALLIGAPDGTQTRAHADDSGRFTMTVDRPGVYSVRHETGEELRRVAVGLPSAASDLSALTPGEFQQRLAHINPASESGWVSGLLDPVRDERHFGQLLLMAGAVLLIIELLLANRTFA
jgi:hypothetical protein